MNKLKIFLLVTLIAVLTFLGYENKTVFKAINDIAIDKDNNGYKIGAILPLTGTGAEDGEFQKHGIELAVERINSTGGINGKPLSIIFEDSKNQAKDGITALNTLVSRDKVPVVLSTMSGVSVPLAAYAGNKVPVVLFVTVASAPNITKHGTNVYRAFVTSDIESRAIAEFMHGKGFTKMAVLYVNDDYGLGGKEEFKKRFTELGGTIALEEPYEKGSTDQRNLVAKVAASDSKAAFVIGYDKSFALLVQQLGQTSHSIQLVTTSTLSVPSWKAIAGPSVDGAYLANSLFKSNPDDPITKEFDDAYQKAYGKPSNYLSASSYTVMMMLAHAIETEGYSKDSIEKGLIQIAKMPTLMGEISISAQREASFPVTMARLVNDKVVNVK